MSKGRILKRFTRDAAHSSPSIKQETQDKSTSLATQKHPIETLVTLFFLTSIIGWVFEVALYLVDDGVLINPGVLRGPWLPIYGTCSLLMLLLLKDWRGKKYATFIMIMALCGFVELITGSVLELATGARWWDYSGFTFNFGGFVCLEALVLFGISGMLLMYVLAPKCHEFIDKIPLRLLHVVLIIILSLFALDAGYSLFHPNYLEF